MAQTYSPEEIQQRCISALGADLGGVHYAIWNEIAWLHVKWAQHVALFGTTSHRIELLNEAAPLFFRIAQDTLWEDMILHLTRLTDPPQSMGKLNLTVRRYSDLVTDDNLRGRLERAANSAIRLTKFARDWRNRHLAHRDLRLALNQPTTPLAAASRAQVKAALKALALVYNCVEQHFFASTTFFDAYHESGDAVSLLYVIRDGIRADRARLERLQKNEITDEDLHPPPAV